MPEPIELSIVTGTRRRPDEYARFIASVRKTVPDNISYEIVVGCANDDVNPDKSYVQPAPDIVATYQRPRLGMLRGYNNTFSHCSGEFVVWFNDDVECLSGWAENALSFMRANPSVGMGAIYFLDRLHNKKDWTQYNGPDPRQMSNAERAEWGWTTTFNIQDLYGLTYANFGILRRLLGEEVGWFPTNIGKMYGSDTAFSWEIMSRGLAVVGIPDARVLHYRTRDDERSQNYELIQSDRELFDSAWLPRVEELRAIQNGHTHLRSPKNID
jgi:GT2 family glycosyltransferase